MSAVYWAYVPDLWTAALQMYDGMAPFALLQYSVPATIYALFSLFVFHRFARRLTKQIAAAHNGSGGKDDD